MFAGDILAKECYEKVRKLVRDICARHKAFLLHADADDIMQEVIIRLPEIERNFRKCEGVDVVFEKYLVGSIKFITLDIIKKEARRKRIVGNPGNADMFHFETRKEEDLVDSVILDVRFALRELGRVDPDLGKVVDEYYFQDLEDEEIGKKLQLNKFQIWRSRKKALRIMQNYLEDG